MYFGRMPSTAGCTTYSRTLRDENVSQHLVKIYKDMFPELDIDEEKIELSISIGFDSNILLKELQEIQSEIIILDSALFKESFGDEEKKRRYGSCVARGKFLNELIELQDGSDKKFFASSEERADFVASEYFTPAMEMIKGVVTENERERVNLHMFQYGKSTLLLDKVVGLAKTKGNKTLRQKYEQLERNGPYCGSPTFGVYAPGKSGLLPGTAEFVVIPRWDHYLGMAELSSAVRYIRFFFMPKGMEQLNAKEFRNATTILFEPILGLTSEWLMGSIPHSLDEDAWYYKMSKF